MKIVRRGSSADHGESSIDLTAPAIAWAVTDACITIKQSAVKDFSTKSRHSYTVRITQTELNKVLQTLAEAAMCDPAVFEKDFSASLKPLLQLQAVVAGLKI